MVGQAAPAGTGSPAACQALPGRVSHPQHSRSYTQSHARSVTRTVTRTVTLSHTHTHTHAAPCPPAPRSLGSPSPHRWTGTWLSSGSLLGGSARGRSRAGGSAPWCGAGRCEALPGPCRSGDGIYLQHKGPGERQGRRVCAGAPGVRVTQRPRGRGQTTRAAPPGGPPELRHCSEPGPRGGHCPQSLTWLSVSLRRVVFSCTHGAVQGHRPLCLHNGDSATRDIRARAL